MHDCRRAAVGRGRFRSVPKREQHMGVRSNIDARLPIRKVPILRRGCALRIGRNKTVFRRVAKGPECGKRFPGKVLFIFRLRHRQYCDQRDRERQRGLSAKLIRTVRKAVLHHDFGMRASALQYRELLPDGVV